MTRSECTVIRIRYPYRFSRCFNSHHTSPTTHITYIAPHNTAHMLYTLHTQPHHIPLGNLMEYVCGCIGSSILFPSFEFFCRSSMTWSCFSITATIPLYAKQIVMCVILSYLPLSQFPLSISHCSISSETVRGEEDVEEGEKEIGKERRKSCDRDTSGK